MLLRVFAHGQNTSYPNLQTNIDTSIDISHIENEHEMTVKEVDYVCS